MNKSKKYITSTNIAIIALMAATDVILSRYLTIHLTQQFTLISFEYIPAMIVSSILGPASAILFGIISDTVGYISNPIGPYLPIWAISAVTANLITSFALYKGKFTWTRIIINRLLILFIVTLGLNFIWQSIYFGASATSFFNISRIISNIIQLPIQVILIKFIGPYALKTINRIQNNNRSV